MEEQLVSLETAKLLKEKGFNVKCLWWQDLETGKPSCFEDSYRHQQRQLGKELNLPTQTIVQTWLRKFHKIFAYAQLYGNSFNQSYFPVTIRNLNPNNTSTYPLCDSYEDALEIALREGLKFVNKE